MSESSNPPEAESAAQKSSAAAPTTASATVATTAESENLQPIYANFVKVMPAPEELILDFALNPNLPGAAPVSIKIAERLVMNFYTAKRLWVALGFAIQRHEQAFGVLEIDVTKRLLPQSQRSAR